LPFAPLGQLPTMRLRRLTTGGIGLLAAATLSLAGCAADNGSGTGTSTGGPATATSAPAASATAELTAAAQKLNDDTVTTEVTSNGLTSSGKIDPKGNKADVTMKVTASTGSADFHVRALGDDVYIQADGLPNVQAGKWLHIDAAKAAGTSFDVIPDGDAAGANRFLNTVADVKKDGTGSYSGTLDLTKVPAGGGVSIDTLGDKAKAVPFTATVDDQGRLTSLTIDMSALNAQLGSLKTTYSDFGSPVTVEAPATSDVVEPDPALLKALGIG
jgi:hypothetical protein